MIYKISFFTLCLFFVSTYCVSQNTFVPDDNFEQALIDLGFDSGALDDFVPTANINTITNLDVPSKNISDLTGIEAFAALEKLDCSNNLISTLDVTSLSNLKILWCSNNQLTAININNNPNLISLVCSNNQLTHLNTILNQYLNVLVCQFNQLTELDVSKNSSLKKFDCSHNNLCKLNLKNGNNDNITHIDFSSNLNLNCIVVDNPNGNHSGWIPTSFSNYANSQSDCNTFVNIDTLNNVLTNTVYILPTLTYGNYFTEPNGKGKQLNPGDSITNSQTIFIYNTSICANNQSSFNVLITNKDYYIPKYFTPNNDGNHDNWQVKDFKNLISKISIFNRNGKLLKSLNPNSNGWNGTYNGKLLSNDDYWYVITLNTGATIKGHFALKR